MCVCVSVCVALLTFDFSVVYVIRLKNNGLVGKGAPKKIIHTYKHTYTDNQREQSNTPRYVCIVKAIVVVVIAGRIFLFCLFYMPRTLAQTELRSVL